MANDFSKEERVAFEEMLEGFNDAEVMVRNVDKYSADQTMMERTGDTIWRPQPYIMNSFDGTDMTSNFNDKTQLSVPASIDTGKSVPWIMTATELRDALQEGRLGDSARQKLASDINMAVLDMAGTYGSLVVPVSTAASGFDDVALCEAIMNEAGVPSNDRYLALGTRDYNGMASNLADRETMGDTVTKAYREAYVGRIASFNTFKLDYSKRLAAAAAGAITIATNSAANFHTPLGVDATQAGQKNVDNRFQTVTVSSTTDVATGDCFTIAAVNAVHHITKEDTGQLKTFRVISVDSSTTMTITPPLIDPDSGAGAESEIQYQNCVVNTASATSAITWLNLAAATINPFYQKSALEILPGRYAIPSDAGTAVMRGSTDTGIELVLQKWYDINTMKTKFRMDTLFGVVNKAPEMSGILLFNQT